jgi:hypothetical protein
VTGNDWATYDKQEPPEYVGLHTELVGTSVQCYE